MKVLQTMNTLSDEELINQILQGEISFYEIIIRRYNPYLYKTCRSYGYNHQDAEDLMQDAYVNAFKNLDSFKNLSSFKTWLLRILLNLCYQKKMKMSTTKEQYPGNILPEQSIPVFTDASQNEPAIINSELGNIIENALQRIPPDYRLIFTMRELNGLSISETIEVLGISKSNVKVRLNRAKAMLRNEIEKKYSLQDIYEFNLVYCEKIVARVMQAIHS